MERRFKHMTCILTCSGDKIISHIFLLETGSCNIYLYIMYIFCTHGTSCTYKLLDGCMSDVS